LTLQPIRTLLVHDRIPANHAVRDAVVRHDALLHVGTVWTVERVDQALRLQSPELVLLDWQLAAASASEVCQLLKVRLLAPRVIMVAPDEDLRHRQAAALSGADATMSRAAPADSLERALAVVFPERFGVR
jgi:DNA-binding NarL/FixJ family response regulator